VVEAAKKTGDYSVLSHADLCVLALTFALSESEKTNEEKEELGAKVEVKITPMSAIICPHTVHTGLGTLVECKFGTSFFTARGL
jgi:hypothetical protein